MKKDSTKKCKVKKISLDDPIGMKVVEFRISQDYLRDQKNDTKEKEIVTAKYFENIFTNEIYYRAMKTLSYQEKLILYLQFYEDKQFSEICNIMKLSKQQAYKLRNKALRNLKNNVEMYKKINKKKGENPNE